MNPVLAFSGRYLFAVPFLLCLSNPAWSAIFNVNSQVDATDASPGNGICETAAGNGVCTLRAAVQESNAQAGGDTIYLPAATYTLSIPGINEDDAASGDLDIKGTLTISGSGVASTIIDGNAADRVFHVLGSTLSMNSLTVRNGRREGSSTDATVVGGGVMVSNGFLNLYTVVVSDNFATLDGGGIYVLQGRANLYSSIVESNTASDRGGGIAIYGTSGSLGSTSLTIDNSVLRNNRTEDGFDGGGIYCSRATVNVSQSRFQANSSWNGGGLYNFQCLTGITQSTFDQNTGKTYGGAISSTSSTITIINSTFSRNGTGSLDGLAGWGGGIYAKASNVSLYSSTVAGNVSASGPGIYTETVTTLSLANSIVADNVGGGGVSTLTQIYGALTSLGYNLIESFRPIIGNPGDTGNASDIVGVDPLLAPLAANGGTTPTLALLPGSPAIDAADPSGCRNETGAIISQDQRGQPKPLDGDGDGMARCDIGAYELPFSPGFIISPVRDLVTTELGGEASFRVRLNTAPTFSVILPLASSNPDEGTISVTQLVFDAANWSSWQTVTVQGVDDPALDGATGYAILTDTATSADPRYDGLNPVDVDVSNYDNESSLIGVTPVSGLTTTEGGGSSWITVSMTAPPTADVNVTLTIKDLTEGTFLMPGGLGIPLPGGGMSDGSYITLLFTLSDWHLNRMVAIYPVSDGVDDGDVTYSVELSVSTTDPLYASASLPAFNVTNIDSDNTTSSNAGGGAAEDGGGGGGGCTIQKKSEFDPVMLMLLVLSAILARRRMN